MRERNGNYGRALSKLENVGRGNRYSGYLTPCEVLELMNHGAHFPTDTWWRLWGHRELERLKKQKQNGICNPRWQVLIMSEEIIEKLRLRK
jgi:hypothetical protein